jgi:hypothetical protein
VQPDLLFLGTEFGLSFTADGGRHWVAIKGEMPVIPIRDLEIQKRENDLVAASFGRGFFVLDDYSALRHLTDESGLFAPGRKARLYEEIGYYRAQGDNVASPNPPMGALLTYYLRDPEKEGRLVVTVTDAAGRQIRQFDAPGRNAGLHRAVWDLRESAPPAPAAGERRGPAAEGDGDAPAGRGRGGVRQGPLVKPGTYAASLARLLDGVTTPLGKPQPVEVAPLEK